MSLTRLCACLRFKARDAARPSPEVDVVDETSQGTHDVLAPDPLETSVRQDFPRLPSTWLPERIRDRLSNAIADFSTVDLEGCWWHFILQEDSGKTSSEQLGPSPVDRQAEAEEILELLNSTVSFCPRDIILDTELKIFIPDYIPAIGSVPLPNPEMPMPAMTQPPRKTRRCRPRRVRGAGKPWRPRFVRSSLYPYRKCFRTATSGYSQYRRCTTGMGTCLARWLRESSAGRHALWRLKSRLRKTQRYLQVQELGIPASAQSRSQDANTGTEGSEVSACSLEATTSVCQDADTSLKPKELEQGHDVVVDGLMEMNEDTGTDTLQVDTFEGALNFFYDAVESFLLDHKELALRSTFLEPVKFYLAAMGREDSGEVQRVRLWANKLLVEDGSVAIAEMPDFWSCLSQEAWEEFTAGTTLGMPYQDLELEGVTVSAKEPLEMTEAAFDSLRRLFAEQYTKERLVAQATQQWQEGPIFQALETLERQFREELGLSWIPWKLNVDRLQRLMAYLGVLRPTAEMQRELQLEPHREMCPICFEEQADVERLDHWRAVGDVSEHKMCAQCRQDYGESKCPFCKENLLKEELMDFIDSLVQVIFEDGAHDAQALSLIMEQWQLHEMEFEASPRVMRSVGQSLMENHAFQRRLRTAVRYQREWLWEAAGLLFRLFGFHEVQPLPSGHLLEEVVELLLTSHEDIGRFGLLYEQALLAWLLSNENLELAQLARRVGWATVVCHASCEDPGSREMLSHQICSTVHEDYFEVSHRPIWGSKRQDLVWQTFCAESESRDLV